MCTEGGLSKECCDELMTFDLVNFSLQNGLRIKSMSHVYNSILSKIIPNEININWHEKRYNQKHKKKNIYLYSIVLIIWKKNVGAYKVYFSQRK